MKKVISISLGSSARDAEGILRLGGETISLARRGTDGDVAKVAALLEAFDGNVDAIGLGGTDLYLVAGTLQSSATSSAPNFPKPSAENKTLSVLS